MSRKQKIVLLALCAGFDALCLAANSFVLDRKGLILLVLVNYCFYRLFKLPRAGRRAPGTSAPPKR